MKTIRRYKDGDDKELAVIIRRSFLEVNIRDYAPEGLEYWVELYTPDYIRGMAEEGNTYVMEEDGNVLGTCTIVRKGTAEANNDAYIKALYVNPDRLGEGIASRLLEACETDPDFANAPRLWVDSSITARPFYEARGYLHETGEPVCIENDRYIMYKEADRKPAVT